MSRAPQPPKNQGTSASRAFKVGVGVAALACSFLLGRATSPPRPAGTSHAEPVTAAARPEVRRAPVRPTPSIPRLATGAAPAAAHSEPSDRRETAAFLVTGLFRRLERRPAEESPETSANAARLYVQGVADTVKQTSPAVRAALAEEFTARLCDPSLQDNELMTMAYLAIELPDITSPRAFDCVFSRRAGREDVVLWSMLDAWRHSGQEKTPAIAGIERAASDSRTQQRFLSPEAELALRRGLK